MRRDRAGELTAVDLRGRGAGGGMTAPLLSFRLDERARRRATERALGGDSAVKGETLRELGDGLEPGTALAALLVEHRGPSRSTTPSSAPAGRPWRKGSSTPPSSPRSCRSSLAASHAGAS